MPRSTVLLDGNAYDRLATNDDCRTTVAKLITTGHIRVIATPVVVDELQSSPFKGIPDWFPVEVEPEAVAILGYAKVGWARLGDGEIYTGHRGSSKKVPDAIIAESAHSLADILVTEDKRCGKRLAELSSQCRPMRFSEFRQWLITLSETGADSAV